jgi:hypothetical protein
MHFQHDRMFQRMTALREKRGDAQWLLIRERFKEEIALLALLDRWASSRPATVATRGRAGGGRLGHLDGCR